MHKKSENGSYAIPQFIKLDCNGNHYREVYRSGVRSEIRHVLPTRSVVSSSTEVCPLCSNPRPVVKES